jgi:hypothetical protein
MPNSNTLDALIEAWKATHPSQTLSEECQTLYLTYFTAPAIGWTNEASPAERRNETTIPPQCKVPRAYLPAPRRFHRRNRSDDTAPPGPAKPLDQDCNSASDVDDLETLKLVSDANLLTIMPGGPSES